MLRNISLCDVSSRHTTMLSLPDLLEPRQRNFHDQSTYQVDPDILKPNTKVLPFAVGPDLLEPRKNVFPCSVFPILCWNRAHMYFHAQMASQVGPDILKPSINVLQCSGRPQSSGTEHKGTFMLRSAPITLNRV